MAQLDEKKEKKKNTEIPELVKLQFPHITVADYLERIDVWLRNCRERGKVGSKCIQLKDRNYLKPKRVGHGKFSIRYAHPRQVIFLRHHNWRPADPYCISHQCGDTLCINVDHYLVELKTINVNERTKCHSAIRRWLNKNRDIVVSNSQYSVRRCKLAKGTLIIDANDKEHVCNHREHPCFVSVHDAKLDYF